MRTGVALGSNLGDRLANLRAARAAILALGGVAAPILTSPVYETEPVDCEPGAGQFLNAVVEFDYQGDPTELMESLVRIEEMLGRKRDHARNMSRKIDLDLLYCGSLEIDNRSLHLPHPRLDRRRFVLQPLVDVRPDLVLPGQTKTIAELLAQSDDSGKVLRLGEDWQQP
jgi:2-amino-4-hydroxy-6-hydroxymethyldihydropteridine diphosphokinase